MEPGVGGVCGSAPAGLGATGPAQPNRKRLLAKRRYWLGRLWAGAHRRGAVAGAVLSLRALGAAAAALAGHAGAATRGLCGGLCVAAGAHGLAGAPGRGAAGAVQQRAGAGPGRAAALAHDARPLGPGAGCGAGAQRNSVFAVDGRRPTAAARRGAAPGARAATGANPGLQRAQRLVACGLAATGAASAGAHAGSAGLQPDGGGRGVAGRPQHAAHAGGAGLGVAARCGPGAQRHGRSRRLAIGRHGRPLGCCRWSVAAPQPPLGCGALDARTCAARPGPWRKQPPGAVAAGGPFGRLGQLRSLRQFGRFGPPGPPRPLGTAPRAGCGCDRAGSAAACGVWRGGAGAGDGQRNWRVAVSRPVAAGLDLAGMAHRGRQRRAGGQHAGSGSGQRVRSTGVGGGLVRMRARPLAAPGAGSLLPAFAATHRAVGAGPAPPGPGLGARRHLGRVVAGPHPVRLAVCGFEPARSLCRV